LPLYIPKQNNLFLDIRPAFAAACFTGTTFEGKMFSGRIGLSWWWVTD
jgi:hypothetical protein